jgi:hypothetical protein
MMTPRHSGNRDTGNLLAHPRSLVKAFLVKPLIPLARIPKSARKDSHAARLPCVIFLKNRKMVEAHPCKPIEKATQ